MQLSSGVIWLILWQCHHGQNVVSQSVRVCEDDANTQGRSRTYFFTARLGHSIFPLRTSSRFEGLGMPFVITLRGVYNTVEHCDLNMTQDTILTGDSDLQPFFFSPKVHFVFMCIEIRDLIEIAQRFLFKRDVRNAGYYVSRKGTGHAACCISDIRRLSTFFATQATARNPG